MAGRVGRCGHVHCWACALHYVDSHEKKPPPCPVCAAPFKVDQFKPARILQWEAPGEEVSNFLYPKCSPKIYCNFVNDSSQLCNVFL